MLQGLGGRGGILLMSSAAVASVRVSAAWGKNASEKHCAELSMWADAFLKIHLLSIRKTE